MLALIQKAIAWLQSKEPAWFRSNSWYNESAVGFLGTGLCAWKLGGSLLGVLIFNAASYAYERWLDPSAKAPDHKPIDDIGQRAAGSLLAAWLWSLL